MLIRFSVENFMSFRDRTELNMTAGTSKLHNTHVMSINKRKILKGSFIFGANAAGKTNLVKAIGFAKNLVIHGVKGTNYNNKCFRVQNDCRERPGVFEFDLYTRGHFYSYGFAISYSRGKILEEWLYDNTNTEKCVFLRSYGENGERIIQSELEFSDEDSKKRFEVYQSDIKGEKMDGIFFLYDVAQRSPEKDTSYDAFQNVLEWILGLLVIFPTSQYMGITDLIEDANSNKKIAELLKRFDTGIEDITSQSTDFDKAMGTMPKDVLDSLKTDLMKALSSDKRGAVLLPWHHMMIKVTLQDDMLHAEEVVSNHGNDKDWFSFRDESDGTKRLFDLLPLFQMMEERVIIIDELDRSLHAKATEEFIRNYYNIAGSSPVQMIATTQEANVLDADLLRKDEIWFVERQEDHSSKLYSLNEFKDVYGTDIGKNYLLGRYGAVPFIRPLNFFEE